MGIWWDFHGIFVDINGNLIGYRIDHEKWDDCLSKNGLTDLQLGRLIFLHISYGIWPWNKNYWIFIDLGVSDNGWYRKKTNRGYKKGTEWHPWILLVPFGYLT
jgi:hypothetical protein